VKLTVKKGLKRFVLPWVRACAPRTLARLRSGAILRNMLREFTFAVTAVDPGSSWVERLWLRPVPRPEQSERLPVDKAAFGRIFEITENKLERFYTETQNTVTVLDLSPGFLAKIRRALYSNASLVAYAADRYLLVDCYPRYESSPTVRRVINDLLSLIVRPPIHISKRTAADIRAFFALVRDDMSKQPYPRGYVVSTRWQEIVRIGMRMGEYLADPLHIAILGMARLAFDGGMPILDQEGLGEMLRQRRAKFDRLHPEMKSIGESALALPGTVIDISGVAFSPNFEQGLGYYHEIVSAIGRDGKMDIVVEVGSGFGKLARILRLSGKSRCIVLVDLAESLALSYAFLKITFPRARFHVVKSPSDVKPGMTDENDFVFCPVQQLQNLHLDRIDLLINTYSLGEMQQGAVDHIVWCLHHGLKPKYFFSLNTIFTDKNLHFAESGNLGQGNEIVLKLEPEWWPAHYDLIARPEGGRYRNELSIVLERIEVGAAEDLVERYMTTASGFEEGSADWLVHAFFAALWTTETAVIDRFFDGLRKYHSNLGFCDMEGYDFDRIGEVKFLKRRQRALQSAA